MDEMLFGKEKKNAPDKDESKYLHFEAAPLLHGDLSSFLQFLFLLQSHYRFQQGSGGGGLGEGHVGGVGDGRLCWPLFSGVGKRPEGAHSSPKSTTKGM